MLALVLVGFGIGMGISNDVNPMVIAAIVFTVVGYQFYAYQKRVVRDGLRCVYISEDGITLEYGHGKSIAMQWADVTDARATSRKGLCWVTSTGIDEYTLRADGFADGDWEILSSGIEAGTGMPSVDA